MIIIQIIDKIFLVYMVMLFIRIFSSWFPEWQNTKFIQFIAFYTDPYLNLFRRLLPPIGGVLDLSPIIAFFALQFLEYIIKFSVVSLIK